MRFEFNILIFPFVLARDIKPFKNLIFDFDVSRKEPFHFVQKPP
jgi:hypothetical protein